MRRRSRCAIEHLQRREAPTGRRAAGQELSSTFEERLGASVTEGSLGGLGSRSSRRRVEGG